MKTLIPRHCWILPVLLVGLGGGCASIDSVQSAVKDRVLGPPPRIRTVDGDLPQVYAVARQTMENLGYQFAGGTLSEGRLEGLSRIEGGDSFQSSQQRSISIRLAVLDGGRVELQVQMKIIVEEDDSRSAMPATETPVRDPAAYEVFFKEVERQLTPSAPGRD